MFKVSLRVLVDPIAGRIVSGRVSGIISLTIGVGKTDGGASIP